MTPVGVAQSLGLALGVTQLLAFLGGHIGQRLRSPLHNDKDVGSNPAAA